MVRAPFVALVFDSLDTVYFAGVLPCFAAVVAPGHRAAPPDDRARPPGRGDHARDVVALLNPGVFRSIHWGHPEELLGGALCVGAVLAALRDRAIAAGPAARPGRRHEAMGRIAVIPALLAAPGAGSRSLLLSSRPRRRRFTLPMILAAPDRSSAVHKQAASPRGPVGPANVWWPFSSPRTAAERAAIAPGFAYEIPAWLAGSPTR